MCVVRASAADIKTVQYIVEVTIKDIYPHYYPSGAVEFFLQHHNEGNIVKDIDAGDVYLCFDSKRAVGTVTVKGNEICRLFVLPDAQGNGYGRDLLRFAENAVSAKYDAIVLDASLPAKAIYMKKGYVQTEYHAIHTPSGDYLCYDVMCKRIPADG